MPIATTPMERPRGARVLVAAWVGSTNLGDELVLAGLVRLLRSQGHQVAAISLHPDATRTAHGIGAIDHRRIDQLLRATRAADLVVWGGGGLVQDETSPFNLPYHLSRAWLAELARTPWVGLGLGAGPVTGRLGDRIVTTLRRAHAVTVRDVASQAVLAEHGVSSRVTADLAVHLAGPASWSTCAEVECELGGAAGGGGAAAGPAPVVVSLRPWGGGGGRLPVSWGGRTAQAPHGFVPTVAAAVDRVARRTGAPIRFVALQTDRDRDLHRAIIAAMETPARSLEPGLAALPQLLAETRLVVAMRYHAGLLATLTGRPSVLLGYSPKVDALAALLGDGTVRLGVGPEEVACLDDAVVRALEGTDARTAAVLAAREQLIRAGRGNIEVVTDALAASRLRGARHRPA